MRRRVVLQTASIALLIVIAFLVPLSITVGRLAAEQATSEAERAVQVLAQNLSVSGIQDRATVDALVGGMNSTSPDTALAVVFSDGAIVGMAGASAESLDRGFGGESVTVRVDAGAEVVAPIVRAEGIGAVVGGFVANDVLNRNVWAANLLLVSLGLALVAIAMLLADRLGRSIVDPVSDLSEAARKVADGDLSIRVEPAGPAELVEVGTAFNRLVERIGALLSAERASVADLAHRLRTPLTAVRLSAESLAVDESERFSADLDQLERTVNHVISEARRPVREGAGARTDLAAIVEERAAFWGALAEEQGREWKLSIEGSSHGGEPEPAGYGVAGHRDDLAAAVDALIGNVLAHTPDGTSYEIEVRTGDDLFRQLVVSDEGPGFSFEPEPGVSGTDSTGIGIDIVRRTAAAHGGWIEVGSGSSGGARIVVNFAVNT